MTKKRTSLSDIMNATAEHFEITPNDLTDFKKQTPQHNQARLVALFVSAEAGYSNTEIANTMKYKSARTVSSKFNKAHDNYSTPTNEENMSFRRDCKAVARMTHVSIPS